MQVVQTRTKCMKHWMCGRNGWHLRPDSQHVEHAEFLGRTNHLRKTGLVDDMLNAALKGLLNLRRPMYIIYSSYCACVYPLSWRGYQSLTEIVWAVDIVFPSQCIDIRSSPADGMNNSRTDHLYLDCLIIVHPLK